MKKKTILILCASLLFVWGSTALCSSAVQGLIFEEATDVTESEFDITMDFNFDFELNPSSNAIFEEDFVAEEITEEFSLDCVETVFSDVCTLMSENDLESADEMSLKHNLISTSLNYSVTPSELNHIKELFTDGLDLEKVLEVYEFLRWTNCDYTYIEQIYNEGIENSDHENWIYDAYDKFFNRTDDILSVEDVAYYVSQGVSVEEIVGAYELSFAGKKTTKAMLNERIEGKTWNEISATSLSENPEIVISAPEMTIDEIMTFKNLSVRQRKDFSELAIINDDKVEISDNALNIERSNRIAKERLMTKHNIELIAPAKEENKVEYSNSLPETLVTTQEFEEDLIPVEEPEVEE